MCTLWLENSEVFIIKKKPLPDFTTQNPVKILIQPWRPENLVSGGRFLPLRKGTKICFCPLYFAVWGLGFFILFEFWSLGKGFLIFWKMFRNFCIQEFFVTVSGIHPIFFRVESFPSAILPSQIPPKQIAINWSCPVLFFFWQEIAARPRGIDLCRPSLCPETPLLCTFLYGCPLSILVCLSDRLPDAGSAECPLSGLIWFGEPRLDLSSLDSERPPQQRLWVGGFFRDLHLPGQHPPNTCRIGLTILIILLP